MLDKQEERRVDSNMAQNWAKNEKVRLWEVSVVDRRTLIEPFVYLASKMTQPQSKSTFPLSRNKNKGSGSTDSWMCAHWVHQGGNCWRMLLILLWKIVVRGDVTDSSRKSSSAFFQLLLTMLIGKGIELLMHNYFVSWSGELLRYDSQLNVFGCKRLTFLTPDRTFRTHFKKVKGWSFIQRKVAGTLVVAFFLGTKPGTLSSTWAIIDWKLLLFLLLDKVKVIIRASTLYTGCNVVHNINSFAVLLLLVFAFIFIYPCQYVHNVIYCSISFVKNKTHEPMCE